jgi:DNA recombination protein RmuC
MVEGLLIVLIVLVAAAVALLVVLLRRGDVGIAEIDLSPLDRSFAAIERNQERTDRCIHDELTKSRSETSGDARQARDELANSLRTMGEANEKKIEALRGTVEAKLLLIQQDNAKQLEQMRATVDEKLQGTLETRLGEKFKIVSERLEQVHRGLGEMQTLALDVGGLKKVLTNIKTRGTWGEIQLGSLLEQILSPEQYAANVPLKTATTRVEFAVRFPGQEDGTPLWLPIDAKFPKEDYERLVEAQERADAEGVEAAGRQLEQRVHSCAQDICRKYINPPQTTDFALMFLPTEGLYAEVIRRVGLVESIQNECRVIMAGPTTLAALLNSLQMGFRTLAIQKRSSEVWNVLAEVKKQFEQYADVMNQLKKKLDQAASVVDDVGVRTRAIKRSLSDVQTLPAGQPRALLDAEAAPAGNGASRELVAPPEVD